MSDEKILLEKKLRELENVNVKQVNENTKIADEKDSILDYLTACTMALSLQCERNGGRIEFGLPYSYIENFKAKDFRFQIENDRRTTSMVLIMEKRLKISYNAIAKLFCRAIL